MKKLAIIHDILGFIAIAAFMTFMAWAAGRAWDNDAYYHSKAHFGNAYEYQGDAQ